MMKHISLLALAATLMVSGSMVGCGKKCSEKKCETKAQSSKSSSTKSMKGKTVKCKPGCKCKKCCKKAK